MIYTHRETPLHELVYQCVRAIEPHLSEFDFIAVRGMSGVAVGAPVAVALGVPLVIVRKHDDNRHNSSKVEGVTHIKPRRKRGLFLDDFVSTGSTRRYVRAGIETFDGKLVAQYLYQDDHYRSLDPLAVQ